MESLIVTFLVYKAQVGSKDGTFLLLLLLLLERVNGKHLAQQIQIVRGHRSHVALVIRQDVTYFSIRFNC